MSKLRGTALASLVLAAAAAGAGENASAQTSPSTIYRHTTSASAAGLIPAAERGSVRAQAELCFLYQVGIGVVQSFPVAATYCQLAAERGNPTAQYLLGLMYDKGQGVARNVVLAYMWLDLAAAHGPVSVRSAYARVRDAIASKMTAAQLAEGQALAVAYSTASWR